MQAKGKMKPLAEVAEGLIDQALSMDSFHPLALHLHVHIAEASSTQPYALLLSAQSQKTFALWRSPSQQTAAAA